MRRADEQRGQIRRDHSHCKESRCEAKLQAKQAAIRIGVIVVGIWHAYAAAAVHSAGSNVEQSLFNGNALCNSVCNRLRLANGVQVN